MFQDFKDLLSSLNESKVKYLVVGGYAVGLHAQPRMTKELDLLDKPDAANASALHKALAAFGAPVTGFTPGQLIERGKFVRFGRPPIAVDILPEIDGALRRARELRECGPQPEKQPPKKGPRKKPKP